jgi:hypothetical protein
LQVTYLNKIYHTFFFKTGLPTCRAIQDTGDGEFIMTDLTLSDKSTLLSGIKMEFSPEADYQKTVNGISPGFL